MGIYGAKLVATNSRVKTVHILATTSTPLTGEVATHPRTACGLTGYRPANAEQIATAARCAACTSAAHEAAARWETAFGGDFLSTWAGHLTDAQLASMPRRERSWFTTLRAGGFVPCFDREAASEALHQFIETWSGTRRTGAKGETVTIRARVAGVREVEGSTEGKKGKRRPMQRVVNLTGTGGDRGAEWITTTRAVAAGDLVVGQEVTVTATVYCVHYRGGGLGAPVTGLGETVTNPTFRAAA